MDWGGKKVVVIRTEGKILLQKRRSKRMKKDIPNEPVSNNEGNMAAKKRIYNPVTETYYEIRQRTTEYGKKGEIKGTWKKKKK